MNILVNDSHRACLADFGLSSILTDKTLGHTFASTTDPSFSLHWAAPEILKGGRRRRNCSSDVWALGCVFYEVLALLFSQYI